MKSLQIDIRLCEKSLRDLTLSDWVMHSASRVLSSRYDRAQPSMDLLDP